MHNFIMIFLCWFHDNFAKVTKQINQANFPILENAAIQGSITSKKKNNRLFGPIANMI